MSRHTKRLMRRMLGALLAVLLTNGSSTGVAQGQVTVTLSALTLNAGASGVVEGRIDCPLEGGCSAFAIAIRFDPAIIRVDRAEVGPYLGELITLAENTVDNDGGTVRLAAVALGATPAYGEPVLLRLYVTALAPGVTALTVTELQIADLAGNEAAAAGIAGAVAVTGGAPLTPEPSPMPEATPLPASETPFFPAGSSNRDWTPTIQEFDGIPYVYVPAGCFMMGSTAEQIEYAVSLGGLRRYFANEQPAHEVCLSAFWIGQTEVTNAQYGSEGAFSGANLPRESVTWFEARDFCASRGARLPTEAEWEYAARGPEGWAYPWGNEFSPDNVVFQDEYAPGEIADVGSKPGGASWVGAQDMSGNVWEWVSSIYRPYPYSATDGRENSADTSSERGSRGGSRGSRSFYLRAMYRIRNVPGFEDSFTGFRCARSAEG